MLGQESLHRVYPLLQGFVSDGLVKQTTAPGERGQTRKICSLTSLGRRNLKRANQPIQRARCTSEGAFHMRVGLFKLLSAAVRTRVLAAREPLPNGTTNAWWITAWYGIGVYGEEIIQHRKEQIQAEFNWVRRLHNCKED